MNARSDRVVRLGYISGVYGIKGWLKVHSFTDPRSNLIEYRDWQLEHQGSSRRARIEQSRLTGKNVLVKLEGIDDRDAAAELIGAGISVPRTALPPLDTGEYYWTDLEGLLVKNRQGELLGRVEGLLSTGANDVLVLDGSKDHLIPFLPGRVVLSVDLDAAEIEVDWEASYWE